MNNDIIINISSNPFKLYVEKIISIFKLLCNFSEGNTWHKYSIGNGYKINSVTYNDIGWVISVSIHFYLISTFISDNLLFSVRRGLKIEQEIVVKYKRKNWKETNDSDVVTIYTPFYITVSPFTLYMKLSFFQKQNLLSVVAARNANTARNF